MKKITEITIASIIILFCGIAFVILGFLTRLTEGIFVGIGTGLISSAIVSFIIEHIHLKREMQLRQKEKELFFHQYKKAFLDFKDILAYIYNKLSCDDQKYSFMVYLEHILSLDSYDDLKSPEGIEFFDEIISDISYHIEKIKFTIEAMLSEEKQILSNEKIHNSFNLIKQQYGNCRRALRSLENNNFRKAIMYIEKMKETHLQLFPSLKCEFEDVYDGKE